LKCNYRWWQFNYGQAFKHLQRIEGMNEEQASVEASKAAARAAMSAKVSQYDS
jgi:hypothetical protein